ncbi:MAG: diacylglycerol kinase [Candidatus Omnitrophica bacterium]|nr:diacylglycerol kinase [Candidatus Omnitrophota bacterium]
MKYFFIFNPGSRYGKSKHSIVAIKNLLHEKKISYDYGVTDSLNDAYELSKRANLSAYDVVVAVGGDGTINKVLNGFYDGNGNRSSSAKLGIIYTGTSPDFCKSYNVPYHDIRKSLSALFAGKTTRIQVGKISLMENENKSTAVTRYFSCCVNVGLGASVARYANWGARKIAGDFAGTLLALMKAFMHHRPRAFSISLDGKATQLYGIVNLSVGKTFYVASGIKVAHALASGDGKFYVLTIRNVRWINVPYCLNVLYSGKPILNSDTISLEYAKSIEIFDNDRKTEVEFDGDPQGLLPCRIEMTRDELELINGPDQ